MCWYSGGADIFNMKRPHYTDEDVNSSPLSGGSKESPGADGGWSSQRGYNLNERCFKDASRCTSCRRLHFDVTRALTSINSAFCVINRPTGGIVIIAFVTNWAESLEGRA